METAKMLISMSLWVVAVVLLGGCDAEELAIFNQGQANDDADVTPTGLVVIDDSAEEWGVDAYVLNSAVIAGDQLKLNISYGGGCRDHVFTLVAASAFEGSSPVALKVTLAHDADNDPCEAFFTEEHHFDLTPIKAMYQITYQEESGVVVLHLEGIENDQLVYAF